MRTTLLASVLVCLATPALAADEGCLKSRQLVIDAGDKNECPDEVAEATATKCDAAIKDSKRLYELIKSCHKRPKKGSSARTSEKTSEKGPSVSITSTTTKAPDNTVNVDATAGATNLSYEGTGDTTCSATAPDGTVIAAFRTDSHSTCGDKIREKVKTEYCAKVGKGTHKYTKISSSKHVAGKPSEASVYCK